MNEIEDYVSRVLHNIHAPADERARIEADLRAHLQEAVSSGQASREVIEHMGTPAEVAAAFMSQVQLRYAGFWARLVAFFIDVALLVAFGLVASLLVGLFINLVPRRDLQPLDWVLGAIWIGLAVSAMLALAGAYLLYFPIMEGRFGRSIGKRALGLVVLKENGLPIGYREAFLRRIPFYFKFTTLDALFIPFTAKKQRAFDIVARTIVVKEQQARVVRGVVAAVATLAVTIGLVAAFGSGLVNLRLQYAGHNTPGELRANYAFFNGLERQTLELKSGQTLHLDYRATVNSGSLEIVVRGPRGETIGGATVPAPWDGDVATFEFAAQQAGVHVVVLHGHATGGDYDVTWQAQ